MTKLEQIEQVRQRAYEEIRTILKGIVPAYEIEVDVKIHEAPEKLVREAQWLECEYVSHEKSRWFDMPERDNEPGQTTIFLPLNGIR